MEVKEKVSIKHRLTCTLYMNIKQYLYVNLNVFSGESEMDGNSNVFPCLLKDMS